MRAGSKTPPIEKAGEVAVDAAAEEYRRWEREEANGGGVEAGEGKARRARLADERRPRSRSAAAMAFVAAGEGGGARFCAVRSKHAPQRSTQATRLEGFARV